MLSKKDFKAERAHNHAHKYGRQRDRRYSRSTANMTVDGLFLRKEHKPTRRELMASATQVVLDGFDDFVDDRRRPADPTVYHASAVISF